MHHDRASASLFRPQSILVPCRRRFITNRDPGRIISETLSMHDLGMYQTLCGTVKFARTYQESARRRGIRVVERRKKEEHESCKQHCVFNKTFCKVLCFFSFLSSLSSIAAVIMALSTLLVTGTAVVNFGNSFLASYCCNKRCFTRECFRASRFDI